MKGIGVKKVISNPMMIGKMFQTFNDFIINIENGKTFIWFAPKYVMMDWESYREISGHKNGHTIKSIIFDEVV